jgi:DNA repair photolyase
MPSGIVFEEIECKSIINKTSVRGMPFWSINPYRGCQHACVYCFARGTHEYLGYDSGRDFESRIVVKTNAAAVLRQELRRPSWNRDVIVLGTACDPYQQAEVKYGITRQLLEVMAEFAQPVHMLTKSPAVVRDLDVWQHLSEVTEAEVAFSIPTLDEAIWKKMEPGTARPAKRLEARRTMANGGVRCGVMIAPIIPGVTDDERHIEEVVGAAKDHGAAFVSPNVLYLKPGTKEWFMPALREAYPHLAGKYERYYHGPYAPKDYTAKVIALVDRIKTQHGFGEPVRHRGERQQPQRGQLAMSI